jgi:hypothetical protein
MWSNWYATSKKDEQNEDTDPPKPSSAESGQLFGMPEMRPGEAASRGMCKLRLLQSENDAENQ